MATPLGSLGPLLGYVQNRRNARDLREYRDYSLGQRDRQLEQSDRRLDLYEEGVELQRNQDERLQQEADVTAQTQFNVDFFDSTVSGLDDFAVNANGAVTVGLDSMRRVLQNQPEVFQKIATQSGAWKTLRDPSGQGYDGITSLQAVPQEDGSISYAVGVQNANTAGPLAGGGSTDDAAPVTMIKEADLLRVFNQGLTTAYGDGGSTAVTMQTRLLNNAMVGRGNMENAAGAVLGTAAGELSQAGVPEGVDAARAAGLDLGEASYDELAQILVDEGGMTPEEVEAQFPRADTEPQPVEEPEDDRTGLGRNLIKKLEKRDRYQNMTGQMSRTSKGKAEEIDAEIQQYADDLEGAIRSRREDGPPTKRGANAYAARTRQMERELEYLNPTAVTAESDTGPIDPPDETITLGNMRELITEKGWTPTEEQVNQTADALRAAGVQSASEISLKLPPRQATLAMAVLAASDPSLNTDQRVKLVNQLVNFAQTGDTEYGVTQQMDDQLTVAQENRMRQSLTFDMTKYMRQLQKDAAALGEKNAGKIGEVLRMVDNYDISWKNSEFLAPLREMAIAYEQAPAGQEKLQYGRSMVEMFGLGMRKYALENQNDGLFNRLQNVFRRESDNQITLDNIANRIRVNVAKDTFTFIDPVDGAGPEDGEIPLDTMRQMMGPAFTTMMTKLAQTRPPVEA
tara:strand:- start:16030 stop:18081 length:2052 start_codon:yes stop_codon:yes gene_type:complete